MNKYEIFHGYRGDMTPIASVKTSKEAWTAMKNYLDSKGIKSYYSRLWRNGDYYIVDYGSHTDFFYIPAGLNMIGGIDNDN